MSLVYFVIHSFSNLANKSTCDPRVFRNLAELFYSPVTSFGWHNAACMWTSQAAYLLRQSPMDPIRWRPVSFSPHPYFLYPPLAGSGRAFYTSSVEVYPHTKKQRSKLSDLYRIQSVLANLKFSCFAPFITLISTSLGRVFHVKIQHINQTCYNLKCFKRV